MSTRETLSAYFFVSTVLTLSSFFQIILLISQRIWYKFLITFFGKSLSCIVFIMRFKSLLR